MDSLKMSVERHQGKWLGELLGILWGYQTIECTMTGETPFKMAFGKKKFLFLSKWKSQFFEFKLLMK